MIELYSTSDVKRMIQFEEEVEYLRGAYGIVMPYIIVAMGKWRRTGLSGRVNYFTAAYSGAMVGYGEENGGVILRVNGKDEEWVPDDDKEILRPDKKVLAGHLVFIIFNDELYRDWISKEGRREVKNGIGI